MLIVVAYILENIGLNQIQEKLKIDEFEIVKIPSKMKEKIIENAERSLWTFGVPQYVYRLRVTDSLTSIYELAFDLNYLPKHLRGTSEVGPVEAVRLELAGSSKVNSGETFRILAQALGVSICKTTPEMDEIRSAGVETMYFLMQSGQQKLLRKVGSI